MKLAAADFQDHYKTLGVSRRAKEDEIKKAYRTLVKEWHPDVNHTANAEVKFKEIQKAFSVLGDRAARYEYDSELLSIETSGLPKDTVDAALERCGATSFRYYSGQAKKKQKKHKLKKAHVFLDEVPDGFGDDSLGEVIPDS